MGVSIVMLRGGGFSLMSVAVSAFLSMLSALCRSQLSVRIEDLALRHPLAIYQRTVKGLSIRPENPIL